MLLFDVGPLARPMIPGLGAVLEIGRVRIPGGNGGRGDRRTCDERKAGDKNGGDIDHGWE